MLLLDANVFLRALVAPQAERDREHAKAAIALFERLARGQETATTVEAILAEVCYVLSSRAHYHLNPSEIAQRLRPLLLLRGLKLPHKRTHLEALELWSANPFLDFEDALLAAHARRLRLSSITSFDTDFDRLPGVVREEP
jgi:predicted nucleic acid-binding protein